MSGIPIIDEQGNYRTVGGSLYPTTSTHPVYKARVSLALPQNTWLYAPTSGHNFDAYKNAKATPEKILEFEKNVKLYLKPYGPSVTSIFTGRGKLEIDFTIPQIPSTGT
jgi:hypothetical protein